MSTIELNKIVGAILLAALTTHVIGIVGDSLVRPRTGGHVAVAVPEGGAPAPAPKKEETGPEPIVPLLAAADPAAGEKVARKCEACHSLKKGGPNKIGPDLWGVVGRERASHEGFSYSSAMQEKSGKWTYQDLNHFLYSPRSFVPGTKMTFGGIKKTSDRANLIAYLRTLSDQPVPIPQP